VGVVIVATPPELTSSVIVIRRPLRYRRIIALA
jgi:hypothetical protein